MEQTLYGGQDLTRDAARREVGRYYDSNTRGFLASGEGGRSLAIHRGVWAPGSTTAAEAAEYVPELMLRQAREIGARKVLDLGCGVGGTCLYLARGLGEGEFEGTGPSKCDTRAGELVITGLTISGVQARLGSQLLAQRGFETLVSLSQSDYTDPAAFQGLPPQDLVVALESLIHSPDLPATLANAAAALKPGGRLVICDDMLMAEPGSALRDLADFRRCWHAYGLTTRDTLARHCRSVGLELHTDDDLSPLLRLFRPRDRLAAFCLPVLRWFRLWPWAQNLVGGTALQRLLSRGILAYRYQVWVKPC